MFTFSLSSDVKNNLRIYKYLLIVIHLIFIIAYIYITKIKRTTIQPLIKLNYII